MPESPPTKKRASSRAASVARQNAVQFDNELSKALVQNSRDGVLGFDRECRITIWNPALEDIFGLNAQTVLGHPVFEVLPFLKKNGEDRRFEALLEGKTVSATEQNFTLEQSRNGGRFEMNYAALKDRTGKIIGGLALIRDTEQKGIEQVARESESHFRQLAEAIPHMVWTTMPNGNFDYCNGRWSEYTGQSREQSQGFGWLDSVHPDHLERVREAWRRSLKSGELYEVEYPLRAKDGSYRWHLDRALPLLDAGGKVVKWFGTCTDVHEKRLTTEIFREMNKVLEKRVDERTKALREVNEQMESFCYTVSHDLRAPLRAMRAFTQVLLEDYVTQLDEAGQDFLKRVGTAAERMDSLIQDLLQYSRLGRMELTFEPVNLEKIVESILLDLRTEIGARNASIQFKRPMPSVQAHETVLHQVLLNLISNALKFVKADVTPRIEIGAETVGEKVRLSISDNGIGIPVEYHSRIFRVFERLHGVENYPGTGIGLAIVQKGVERMNGTVSLKSEVGKGSCFWVEFPKAAAAKAGESNGHASIVVK